MKRSLKRILLLRTDRIGDVVLTTPAVTVLRDKFPDIHITFMAREYTRPMLERYRGIDDIFVYDPEKKHHGLSGHWRLAKELRELSYDAAIFFYPRPRLAAAVKVAGIPLRIGNGYKWYGSLFNERIYEHRKRGSKHELEQNLVMLQSLIGEISEEIQFDFQIEESLENWQKNLFKKEGISADYYIIHPGSGGSAPNLSTVQYRTVYHTLLQHSNASVVFTGSAEERRIIDDIIAAPSDRIFNMAGKFDLVQLMAVVNGARLLIASSTGPIHLANAFRVPVIGFYCPSAPCAPQRWGPYHQLNWVMVPEVAPCTHCSVEKCSNGNCLAKIPDGDITTFIDKRLSEL